MAHFRVFLPLSSSLSQSMLGNETKGYSRAFFLGVYGMDFYSDRSEEKAFPAVFVVDKMVLVTCFGIVLIIRLYLHGNYLSSPVLSLVT